MKKKLEPLGQKLEELERSEKPIDQKDIQEYSKLRRENSNLQKEERDHDLEQYQDDWAARVELNGKVSGVFTDYHYYGTGECENRRLVSANPGQRWRDVGINRKLDDDSCSGSNSRRVAVLDWRARRHVATVSQCSPSGLKGVS